MSSCQVLYLITFSSSEHYHVTWLKGLETEKWLSSLKPSLLYLSSDDILKNSSYLKCNIAKLFLKIHWGRGGF